MIKSLKGNNQSDGKSDSDEIKPLERPSSFAPHLFWTFLGPFIFVHCMALLMFVPWFFSWTGVASVFVGTLVFGGLGIGLAYHRLLTHRGLTLPKWLEYFFALLGVCSLQDSPARWVGIHRMHHQHTDDKDDPHSPHVNFFWGHMGWLIYRNQYVGTPEFFERYVPDLIKEPFYRRLERDFVAQHADANGKTIIHPVAPYVWIYLAHACLFFVTGTIAGCLIYSDLAKGIQFGASILIWGVFVRTVCGWHITWAVNSITHLWGYRNYDVGDQSRNNWLIGIAAMGEGWHNTTDRLRRRSNFVPQGCGRLAVSTQSAPSHRCAKKPNPLAQCDSYWVTNK